MHFILELFDLKASKGEDKESVKIDEFGDYLISLGLCPDLNFLYKVIVLAIADDRNDAEEADVRN